jgi:DNA polymerase III alpha subunit
LPDIDIDFYDREDALKFIKHIPASRIENNQIKKHNTGVYLQEIPIDKVTGLSSLDYDNAEERGYFKVDFLNVSIYKDIKSETEIERLLTIEPLWDLLEQKEFCDMIFHVNGYHDLIARLRPQSIEELAMFLALLRPGKKHLVPICEKEGFQSIKDEIWVKTEDAYSFKKSHAVAYSHAIVVQMNKICEGVSYGFS